MRDEGPHLPPPPRRLRRRRPLGVRSAIGPSPGVRSAIACCPGVRSAKPPSPFKAGRRLQFSLGHVGSCPSAGGGTRQPEPSSAAPFRGAFRDQFQTRLRLDHDGFVAVESCDRPAVEPRLAMPTPSGSASASPIVEEMLKCVADLRQPHDHPLQIRPPRSGLQLGTSLESITTVCAMSKLRMPSNCD